MKFYILGSTRGLGEYLSKEFNCQKFDRPYDLSKDIDLIIDQIEDNSIVILNAYADGSQIEYVKRLMHRCKLIICGSIASTFPDPFMVKYSKNKFELEKFTFEQSIYKGHSILYLKLTSSSYKDYKLIADSIKFWLENPAVTFIGYNVDE